MALQVVLGGEALRARAAGLAAAEGLAVLEVVFPAARLVETLVLVMMVVVRGWGHGLSV